jgi:hypothetical protein
MDRLVGVFQARATHAARQAGLVSPREPLWQRGYFDRIIRTQHEHAALIAYIETNPVRWTLRLPMEKARSRVAVDLQVRRTTYLNHR